MLEFLCFFEKNMKNHDKNQKSKMTFFMIHIDRNIVEPVSVAHTQPWHYPTIIGLSEAIANFVQNSDFWVSTTWGLDRLFRVYVPPYAKWFKIREFQPSSFAIKKMFPHVYKSLLTLQALFSYTKNTVMSKRSASLHRCSASQHSHSRTTAA